MRWAGFLMRLSGLGARLTGGRSLGDPLDEAPVGYAVLDARGRIVRANTRLAEMLGYSPSRLVGRRTSDFYPDTLLGQEKADRLRADWQAGRELHGEELEMLRADGSIRVVSTTLSPIFDDKGLVIGARAVLDDLTARRQAEEVLRQAETRFRVIFENSPISMQISDRNGRYLEVNPAICRMLGYSKEQLFSMRVWEVVHPDDLEEITAARDSVLAGEAQSVQYTNRFVRRDGSIGWAKAAVSMAIPGAAIVAQIVEISDLVETQAKLTASEELFRDLFEQAPIGYLSVDQEGVIVQVNRRCAEILGGTSDELVGRAIIDFYPDTPSGRASALSRRERWLSGDELKREEFQVRRADGQLRWVRATVSPIVGPKGRAVASRSLWEDVTEQKKTEEALRRAEARFRVAFENAPIGMQLSTADGRFLRVNPALCRMLGYSEEQLLTMKVGQVIHPDDVGRYMQARAALFAGEVDQIEVVNRFLRSDGSSGWCRVGATLPGVDEGYAVTQVADITDLVEAQEKLSDLMGEKDRFIATVSHELRTPLAGALGFAKELQTRAADFSKDEVGEFAGLIAQGCDTAANLVEDLLMAARMDSGRVTLSPLGIDLRRESRTVIGEPGVAALRGGKEVLIAGELGIAWADPHRARQILRNLVVNALRHGGDRVEIVAGRRLDRLEAFLEVIDDGPGVAPELVGVLFQPFKHGAREGGQTESVGLGLYLSRNLARLMGGNLTYSRKGDRTVFELSLPMKEELPA